VLWSALFIVLRFLWPI
jgi:hypothetical protein